MANLTIPSPSPLPSPSETLYSLSERINIATRPIHSQLNRLILARLPLALPPHTTNPSTYISGLLHITPIYMTFESAWQAILDAPKLPTTIRKRLDSCDPEDLLLDSKDVPVLQNTNVPPLIHTPQVCSRTYSLLAHLRLPGLLRAGRLRADIRILTGTPEHKIDEQLQLVSRNGRLAAFIAHTKRSVDANPHVLLAYAWVLYMALFSGGRYLRAMLQDAGGLRNDFWGRDPSPVRPYAVTGSRGERRASRSDSDDAAKPKPTDRSRPQSRSDGSVAGMISGMQFFNFMGDEDGEDIKTEFKKRIVESEILLTQGEKEDIIAEAEAIFKFMVEMVGELDKVMAMREGQVETEQHSIPPMRSRDSLSVTLERFSRNIRSPSDEFESDGGRTNWRGLVVSPMAKLVRFDHTTEKSLDGEYTKDGHIQQNLIAFPPVLNGSKLSTFWFTVLTTLLPSLAVAAGFLLWKMVY